MLREHPRFAYRGKEFILSGRAQRFGRPVSLIGHTIRFAIADKDTMRQIVTMTSGAGIEQDEVGNWKVTIPGNTVNRNNFPVKEYWWELDVLPEGDTARARPLARGPFNVLPSPFAS